VEVAGLSAGNDSERMLFPLLRTARAAELVAAALPELNWRPVPLRPVPARARRRYLTLPLLFAAVLTVAATRLPGWGAYLAVVPVPLAVVIGCAQAAAAAWSLDEDTVTFRWQRMLARHTVVARRRRVQLVEVTRTPFQRRVDLAGARLLLAPRRRARIRHLDAPDADFLLHCAGRSTRAAAATYRGR
jgi:putative membrane protein